MQLLLQGLQGPCAATSHHLSSVLLLYGPTEPCSNDSDPLLSFSRNIFFMWLLGHVSSRYLPPAPSSLTPPWPATGYCFSNSWASVSSLSDHPMWVPGPSLASAQYPGGLTLWFPFKYHLSTQILPVYILGPHVFPEL